MPCYYTPGPKESSALSTRDISQYRCKNPNVATRSKAVIFCCCYKYAEKRSIPKRKKKSFIKIDFPLSSLWFPANLVLKQRDESSFQPYKLTRTLGASAFLARPPNTELLQCELSPSQLLSDASPFQKAARVKKGLEENPAHNACGNIPVLQLCRTSHRWGHHHVVP